MANQVFQKFKKRALKLIDAIPEKFASDELIDICASAPKIMQKQNKLQLNREIQTRKVNVVHRST